MNKMKPTLVDQILKERELKNEKNIALIRFVIIFINMALECLHYFGFIPYGLLGTTSLTLVLDSFFLVFAAAVLIIVLKKIHFRQLKFLTITLDYLFISIILVLDPSVPREGGIMNWTALVGSLFLFYLNLLRYSRAGTLYAGALSVAMFSSISLIFYRGITPDFFAMIISLAMFLTIGYSITASNRKMMTEANAKLMMERYLPPQLVGELYKEHASLEPGGTSRKVTVLFSDIRSFTSISESLPPREVVTLLNDYLSAMTDVIFAHNGTIDKFVGDAIMTVFGAPVQAPDDALRAVRTAIRMTRALREFNQAHSNLKQPLKIGIGIHTGDVIAGNIGSDKRLDYTVIGDNVNLSSRIEGLTKFYHCPILISESTYAEIAGADREQSFVLREADHVIVKGRTRGIRIYEVLPFGNEEERVARIGLKERFEKGLGMYRERRFREAAELFSSSPADPLSTLYAERCERLIQEPPDAAWSGIFTMESK